MYFFLGTELSKKHIRKSSSSSKISTCSADSKVRTIEIKRESLLQRSNSGSSDTSSGFGSLNIAEQQQNLSKEADLIKQKLESNPVTKLQLLQERSLKNRLNHNLTEHHPSFANHFGFRYRTDPFFVRNNRRIMNSASATSKVQVSKSKSSDTQSYR